jgi:hypothetical protein
MQEKQVCELVSCLLIHAHETCKHVHVQFFILVFVDFAVVFLFYFSFYFILLLLFFFAFILFFLIIINDNIIIN